MLHMETMKQRGTPPALKMRIQCAGGLEALQGRAWPLAVESSVGTESFTACGFVSAMYVVRVDNVRASMRPAARQGAVCLD